MPDRVVVFVDYQNVYRRARDAFHDHNVDPHWCGQVDPVRLGQHLAADANYDRTLQQVRVYRGMPANSRDPRGYAATRRQVAAWETNRLSTVITRTLQYPYGWPNGHLPGEAPREKGIDVALAVDLAVMASRKEYDVAILCSLDTDLKPSLEFVCDLTRAWGKPRVEVSAWSAEDQTNGRLSVPGRKIFCHWIDLATYSGLRDDTNYSGGPSLRRR